MKKEILDIISKNSRYSLEDLAAMIGTDEETVAREIKEMEDDKIICGYPALINWDNTSHEKVTALIEVNVTPQRDMGFNKVAERIYKFEEVESVYLMSGGFDLTVIIQGKSMKEVARFVSEKLSTLEYVNSTATYFVLKKYREHGITMEEERMDSKREGEIKGAVETCKNFNMTLEKTIQYISDHFDVSLQQAEDEVKKYWK